MDDTEFLAILHDADHGLDPGVGWKPVHAHALQLIYGLTAALERLAEVEVQRDVLRGQAEELAHAAHHVIGCPMGCAECKKVTTSALAHENLQDFMDQQAWMEANDEGEET